MSHAKLRPAAMGLLLCTLAAITPCRAAADAHWIATWAAAPDDAGPSMRAVTIRQIVRSSAAGSSVRIRLSNLNGSGRLIIGPVHIALHAAGAAIQPGSDHPLTFNGSGTLTIAKGQSALSDPVAMDVAALQELAISLYVPTRSGPSTQHGVGMQKAWLQPGRDATVATDLPHAKSDGSYYFLTDVEVAVNAGAGTIIALGDSITDGVGSTAGASNRWPDVLAARLQASPGLASMAVANSGIAGNRLLQDGADPFRGQSALARFERDVLGKPGVRWVLLQEGTNDIGASSLLGTPKAQASAQQIIDGMKALVARAHAGGIKVACATLMPNTGADFGTKRPYHTAAGEAIRQTVNTWIRSAGAFDGVLDFDQALRDPAHPDRLLAAFDSGDHLHPNVAGHKAMAEAVDLGLFDDAHRGK